MDKIMKINDKIDEMIEKINNNKDMNNERDKIFVRGFLMRIENNKYFNNEIDILLSAGSYKNKCGMNVNGCMKIIEELDSILSNGDENISKERKKTMKKAQILIKIADRYFNKSKKLIDYINRLVQISNKNKDKSIKDNDTSMNIEKELSKDNENNHKNQLQIEPIKDNDPTINYKENNNNQTENGFNVPDYKIIEEKDEIIIEMELPNEFDIDNDLKFEIDENNLDSLEILGFNEPIQFTIDPSIVDVTHSFYRVIKSPLSTIIQSQPNRILRVSIPKIKKSIKRLHQNPYSNPKLQEQRNQLRYPTSSNPYHHRYHQNPYSSFFGNDSIWT